jgi:hypothetical protein
MDWDAHLTLELEKDLKLPLLVVVEVAHMAVKEVLDNIFQIMMMKMKI